MRSFEDVTVGEEVTFAEEYVVTEEEIIEMGRRWDPQPFHIDPVAARDSIFGGLVASSAHIFAIYVSIGNGKIDESRRIAAVTALGFDKLRWHAPVRPNDVLRQRYRVVEARVSKSKPDLGIVTAATTVFNQTGEAVFTLDCSFLVPRREAVAR